MRAIVIGVGELAIRILESLISRSRRILLKGVKGIPVLIRMDYVEEGKPVPLESQVDLQGLIKYDGKGMIHTLNLQPSNYAVKMVAYDENFIYPEVRGIIPVEEGDELIEAVGEVYHRAPIVRGEEKPFFKRMILGGLLGLLSGAIAVILRQGISTALLFTLGKLLGLSTPISYLVYRVGGYDPERKDQPKLVITTYLSYLFGLALGLTFNLLSSRGFPWFNSLSDLTINVDDELLILSLGALTALVALILWLSRELESVSPGTVLPLVDWELLKKEILRTLLAVMGVGSLIGSAFASLVTGGQWSELAYPVISTVASLILGGIMGLSAIVLRRGKRWELGLPMAVAAGVYVATEAALDWLFLSYPPGSQRDDHHRSYVRPQRVGHSCWTHLRPEA